MQYLTRLLCHEAAGVDSLLLAKCPGNAVLVPQHGGPSQSSGASLQEPSAYVSIAEHNLLHDKNASLLTGQYRLQLPCIVLLQGRRVNDRQGRNLL